MPGRKPSSAAPPFAMEPPTRLRVNQWTGKYLDSFLSGGNPISTGCRLFIEFVSGRCDISESTVFLSTKVHGTTVAHDFVPVRTVNNTEGSFSHPTRIQRTSLSVEMYRSRPAFL
jgi:hypothetical protein